MRIAINSSRRGIALVTVMVAIFILAALAGTFASLMKVETKLAMNANHEAALLWLGRSGVERARWILALQLTVPNEPYDSLNQIWAGGPGSAGESNSPLANISLQDYKVGEDGTVSLKIMDLERKININTADPATLQQALTLMGVDASEIPSVADAILDWIDPDDNPHINGAESDYYQGLNPRYLAKNGPLDDLSELLLVRGVTQDMYWGPASTNHTPAAFQRVDRLGRPMEAPGYSVGLVDIFTPISTGKININTASEEVLQMVPLIDQQAAALISQIRSESDGLGEPRPVGSPGKSILDVLVNAGLTHQAAQQVARYFDVRSRTFEVQVDAEIGGSRRTFHAILGRNSPRDIQVLSFY